MFKGGYQIIQVGVAGDYENSYAIKHAGLYEKIEAALNSVIMVEQLGYQASASDLPLAIAPAIIHFKATKMDTVDCFVGLLDSYVSDGETSATKKIYNRYLIVADDGDTFISTIDVTPTTPEEDVEA